ncbi:WxL domain-containing protein [Candidatus Enterococcus clewellii]|uniref:WxL domain-containing protein n=1 Tax=Candidatus Enterococcus clewellii TaxID=1834193 RepID=A0A242K8W1_9ENTE|nr:WxL domain-containing protein [Enterococcus sp. 9E7_DIV0242]OTP17603.1 hypothetical protein A5888_001741 [Enterococcus sp. 9E7_DIV0242]
MKLRKLCAIALVGTIGVATVGTVSASADQLSLDSKGTVEVEGGMIDPTKPDNITDAEKPDGPAIPPTTPGVETNPDIKDKGIIAVSHLDFGKIQVNTTSAYAAPLTLEDGAGTRGNIVSFGDVTGNYTGYTVTGELTSQFTNTTTTLDGASITYTNPLLDTSGTGTIAAAVPTSVVLSTDGGVQTFVTAAAGEGSGLWTLEFGQSSIYEGPTAGTDANSVELSIPTSVASAMTTGMYTATVTWTLGALA